MKEKEWLMKKVDFVFQYEGKARELDTICLIAAYLKNKGYRVAFINSWESMLKRPTAYASNVVVLSACYNDIIYDNFTGFIGKFRKVVNMQWEQVLRNECYMMKDNSPWAFSGTALETKHACWGKKQVGILHEKYGMPVENLEVLGYVPLDFYREELQKQIIPRDELFKRYGLDPNKKTLLFISSFALVELPESEKQGRSAWFDAKTIADTETRRQILEWFDRLASENSDMQIIYRYHPTEKNSKVVENIAKKHDNFFLVSDEAIRHWILACDKIYNWISTCMIEVYCSKKDAYILRPTKVEHDVDIPVFENAESISSYDEFKNSALEEKMKKFPVPERDLLQWYDIKEKPAYERYGEWLINIYNSDQYFSRASKYNVHKGRIWKEIKSKIKDMKCFQNLIVKLEQINFGGKLGQKISQISSNLNHEKISREEIKNKDSYMNQKRILNSASIEEINSKLAFYQELIK